MSLDKYEAERILSGAIGEWLKETDINGTKVIEENLQRLNEANILAMGLLKDSVIEQIDFETPSSGRSFTTSYIYCQGLDIEGIKKLEAFQKLIQTVDEFFINPIDEKTVQIAYSIDNIWVE